MNKRRFNSVNGIILGGFMIKQIPCKYAGKSARSPSSKQIEGFSYYGIPTKCVLERVLVRDTLEFYIKMEPKTEK